MNTQQEVLNWLISHKVKNFSINEDLTVDVKGTVNIGAQDLIEIPIQFGIVTGSFNCAHAKLISLKDYTYDHRLLNLQRSHYH